MKEISDLLGIEHFSTANGSTVRSDFLHAVARALGVNVRGLDKDGLILRIAEAATQRPAPHDLLSKGGTVTNRTLRYILDGLQSTRQVDTALLQQPVLEYVEDAHDETVHASVPTPAEVSVDGELAGFNPADVDDERSHRLALVVARQGQDRFRASVLDSYSGACAITGFDAVGGLEAAHIFPYRGRATHHPSNGLCLRSDLHNLFDRGLLAVHETTLRVLLKPELLITRYRVIADVDLRLPRLPDHRPSRAALHFHREWAGL